MQSFLHKKRKLGKKGFTLIELIVVIAVIGILVLLAAPKFLGYTKDAKVAALQADAKVLENAALMYNIDTEAWPLTGTDADADDVIQISEATAVTIATDSDLGEALELVAEATMYSLDKDTLGNYVKSTKNAIDTYVIDISNGEVYTQTGQVDSKGNTWFGTSTEVEPAE